MGNIKISARLRGRGFFGKNVSSELAKKSLGEQDNFQRRNAALCRLVQGREQKRKLDWRKLTM